MKNISQTLVLGGVNLLALGASATDATVLQPVYSSQESSQKQSMSVSEMRMLEASHLEVYAGCKWGHASFEPIKVESENLPSEVQALYNQMV